MINSIGFWDVYHENELTHYEIARAACFLSSYTSGTFHRYSKGTILERKGTDPTLLLSYCYCSDEQPRCETISKCFFCG